MCCLVRLSRSYIILTTLLKSVDTFSGSLERSSDSAGLSSANSRFIIIFGSPKAPFKRLQISSISSTFRRAFRRADITADHLEIVLSRGGFSLKGIAYSGKDPPGSLSDDGVSVLVAGIRWFTKEDKISLNMGKLMFAKKQRGRKVGATNIIPKKLTRRHCVSKVAEIFDIAGKITPITAAMKLDLHELVQRKLDWDDFIPDDLSDAGN